MKNMILLCGLLCAASLSAQTSVGIQDDNSKPLKDYRLPNWGYSTGSVGMTISANALNDKASDYSSKNDAHRILLLPDFYWFAESEERRFDAHVSGAFDFSGDTWRTNDPEENSRSKRTSRSTNSGLHIDAFRSVYNKDNHWGFSSQLNHYNVQMTQKYRSEDLYDETAYTSKSKDHLRFYDAQFSFFIGIGHIRNVTPVIRALRLRERFNALGKNTQWDQAATDHAAVLLAQSYGYTAVYDRPDKYFWKSIGENGENLTSFETHYLNDVLNESLGNRQEGNEFDLAGRALRLYAKRKRTVFYDPFDESEDGSAKLTFAGPELRLRSYSNYSLRGQLGAEAHVNLDFGMNDKEDNPIERVLSYRLEAHHLYCIGDRVLWNFDPSYSFAKLQTYDDEYGSSIKTSSLDINMSLTYFIEDRMSLIAGFNWRRLKNDPESFLDGYLPANGQYYINGIVGNNFLNATKRQTEWHFDISLKFYLDRRLR